MTVLTEPSPLPQPPPTSGSEQIGFLKTINCSCPPGEKVHSPLPAAGLGPQSAVGPELTALAGEVGISHHAHGLPGQDDPGLQVTLGSGDHSAPGTSSGSLWALGGGPLRPHWGEQFPEVNDVLSKSLCLLVSSSPLCN